jgi:hypothetical protein
VHFPDQTQVSVLFLEVEATVDDYIARPSISPLKKKFQTVIADKTIPLEKRWALFAKTPISMGLKNVEPYIQHLKVLDSFIASRPAALVCSYTPRWEWSDWCEERYWDIDLCDFVDEWLASWKLEDEFSNGPVEPSDSMYYAQEFANQPDLMNALKEEILERNLGQFTMDW